MSEAQPLVVIIDDDPDIRNTLKGCSKPSTLERLVPDLLEKMNPQGNGGTNNAPAGSVR